MGITDKLKVIGPGIHSCGWFSGFIEIEEKEGFFTVLWTTGRDSHQPLEVLQ